MNQGYSGHYDPLYNSRLISSQDPYQRQVSNLSSVSPQNPYDRRSIPGKHYQQAPRSTNPMGALDDPKKQGSIDHSVDSSKQGWFPN
mmetsp:Transcript_22920/g.35277  ORF Transcript_22920/g.35277 Transcript_22920/m.35277 type:complete len:87 (+) Transcript_22920:2-262(+)